ncbi:DUF1588 domain-containing protein [Sorangium sp. So ce1024]|uniref:DUF1588 domain-containing protein n=1 Tax=Sorangium sp. So ce1024 TaxID=3133327 RepID=UPI003F09883E
MSFRSSGWICGLGFLGLACTGQLGDPSSQSASGGTGSDVPLPQADGSLPYAAPRPASAALRARAWLLTPEEYGRSVRDLLGVTVDVSDMDPVPDNGIYPNMSTSGLVRVSLAEQYAAKAEAAVLALSDQQLRALIPCGKVDATCKADFLRTAIGKAFRRPATAEDLTSYGEVFDLAAASGDTALGFRWALKGLMSSPYFLYRTEIGAPSDEASPSFRLTDHEIATFLSYSVLGAPPSEALVAAADRGELADPALLPGHIEQLLATPGAADQLGQFLVQWLRLHTFEDEVDKFEDVFPGFTKVKAAMFAETQGFLRTNGGMQGSIASLLTAPVPRSDAALSAFYSSDPSGATDTERRGVLSLGAVLARTAKPYLTSPTLRGLFIRDQLLCQHITLPENFTPPPIEESELRAPPKTTRELYETHAAQPVCNSCHALTDDIGYMLENFDGAGRYRTLEQYRSPSFTAPMADPQPIDAAGRLVGTDVDGEYDSAAALGEALSRSTWVRECVARQAFRFYFGQVEPARGVPPVVRGTAALERTGLLRDMLVALLSSPSTIERVRE